MITKCLVHMLFLRKILNVKISRAHGSNRKPKVQFPEQPSYTFPTIKGTLVYSRNHFKTNLSVKKYMQADVFQIVTNKLKINYASESYIHATCNIYHIFNNQETSKTMAFLIEKKKSHSSISLKNSCIQTRLLLMTMRN